MRIRTYMCVELESNAERHRPNTKQSKEMKARRVNNTICLMFSLLCVFPSLGFVCFCLFSKWLYSPPPKISFSPNSSSLGPSFRPGFSLLLSDTYEKNPYSLRWSFSLAWFFFGSLHERNKKKEDENYTRSTPSTAGVSRRHHHSIPFFRGTKGELSSFEPEINTNQGLRSMQATQKKNNVGWWHKNRPRTRAHARANTRVFSPIHV